MMGKDESLTGIVTSRKCPCCGHHEVGFTTEDGVFHPLRAGSWIRVSQNAYLKEKGAAGELSRPLDEKSTQEKDMQDLVPWVPEPLKGDRSLRLKYGVLLKGHSVEESATASLYQSAYLHKLERLIAKEVETPIAVILDQFFTAPHLASGNPEEIALAMWRELDEIRQPVLLITSWLENPSDIHMEQWIRRRPEETVSSSPVTGEQMRRELQDMTLEEFLSLL